MKRIVFLTCIGSLALALTALGAPREKQAARSGKAKPAAHAVSGARSGKVAAPRVSRSAPRVSRSTPRMSRSVAPRTRTQSVGRASASRGSRMEAARTRSVRTAERATRTGSARTAERAARTKESVARDRAEPGRKRTAARAEAAKARATQTARDRRELSRERAVARAETQRRIRAERARATETVAARTRAAARTNLRANRQRNLTLARNVLRNRAGDVRIVNNWRSDRFRGANYAAFYNYNRVWHDRWWWRNNHTNIVFVLGGWWYWNAGYWYPAWGYDPYAWYGYDGPIYTGYATVTPDQVIVNVQVALRDQGYYVGATDGVMGPQTRAALAAFQADNGLEVTSAVDQPTLQTMGLA
jgi:Putative peptidoglycan binding domain